LWAIEHIHKEYAAAYDLIIFDTPPTALTLRFLAMPSITGLWVRQLSAMREKILKKRQTILALNPEASIVKGFSPARDSAGDEAPVQGAMDKNDDQIYIKLSGIGRRLTELQRLFSQESYLSVVVNPDTLSLSEALRIRGELDKLGVHINSVCLNKASSEGAGRENVEKNFGNCPVFMSRLLTEGIRTVSDLGAIDIEGVKNDITGARECLPLPVGAQGIEAESPQDLHGQIRGLGADSPVFFCGLRKQSTEKNAPEDCRFPIGNLL
jgi:arsenite-transporting ATPase